MDLNVYVTPLVRHLAFCHAWGASLRKCWRAWDRLWRRQELASYHLALKGLAGAPLR
jgi:hypothetical protein